jgi:putative nucleotidyltransferase with HDIG domain
MSLPNQSRTRSERVAQFDIGPNRFVESMAFLRRGDVLLRVVICCISAVTMWLVTGGWQPPFPYRTYQTPKRNVVAETSFEVEDPVQTANQRERARRSVQCVYDHDVQPLIDLHEALKGRIQVIEADPMESSDQSLWQEFVPASSREAASEYDAQEALAAFREALADDENLEEFQIKLAKAMDEIERYGVLDSVQHALGEGSQTEICVSRLVDGKRLPRVPIEQVRKVEALQRLRVRLNESFGDARVADPLFEWLKKRIPTTLKYNLTATEAARKRAEEEVGTVKVVFQAGEDVLAPGGEPLKNESVELLRREHETEVAAMSFGKRFARTAAALGMYVALYLLCGGYIYFRRQDLINNFRSFITLQAIAIATVALAKASAWDKWQAELIPLMLFAMTVTIAHGQEVALLLSAAICLAVCMALGIGLAGFVIFSATIAATILMLRRIRSRTKLIYIGLWAAGVAFLTSLGVGTVMGLGSATTLLVTSFWYALFAVISTMLMTGLLPFIENMMDVQTEISLLELGDVAHPLLQELVRRAPGTYNHSINVASMAEAAAEAIGANGLLVRVGSYFHDIGKMLKPQYFVENQAKDENVHQTLLPAMSTLIIIAHVKDGADLARQHHLPKSVIDFILQHHGTTLVEYFYDRANKISEEDPHASEVDEVNYRYPGPKPQTREAGVLMLADSVESASRTLQDPTPARIDSLVHEIAMKKLLDGQFDECDLTLQELRTIQDSLVKSLTAMYHGRVKYPDQQSA